MNTIFTENWEQYLETQFLKNDSCRKRAYICSPLSAEAEDDFLRNMHAARAYMYYASEKMGMYTRAPHAYLPMLLCDKLPSERALALSFGLSLLENSEIILVCGNRLSSGMRGEIRSTACHVADGRPDESGCDPCADRSDCIGSTRRKRSDTASGDA